MIQPYEPTLIGIIGLISFIIIFSSVAGYGIYKNLLTRKGGKYYGRSGRMGRGRTPVLI